MTVDESASVPSTALTVFVNVPSVVPAVNTTVVPVAPDGTVPPPLTTDHVGLIGTMLPPASLPTAVNVCVPPGASVVVSGVTTSVATGPAITMTFAVPKIEPDVALTLALNVPVVLPAVNRPVDALMVPGGFVVDHTGVS